MISLRVSYPDGREETISARQYGHAFDIATERGAVRAVDGVGGVHRWLYGEWVYVCQQPARSGPREEGDTAWLVRVAGY